MKNQDLIRMANQIADFFEAYPQPEAVAETANHLRAFWEPRMRRQLEAFVRDGGAGLDGIAGEAVISLGNEASPTTR